MNKQRYLTIVSDIKKILLNSDDILYIVMVGKNAEIHLSDGKIYRTRMTFGDLETKMGEGFVKIHRGCILFDVSEIELVGDEYLYSCAVVSYR